jgi:predicted AlkP superfamily pyrophosphatase or phosphodiesterase
MTSKLLLLILDACRPDGLAQARTPHLDSLWQTGAYTWTARSVMPSVTLPAHMSMLRGVSPEKHGIGDDNVFVPGAAAFPSVMDIAKQAGLHTAMFYSWEQLRDLAAPGSLNMSFCRAARSGEDSDMPVATAAAAYLAEEQPDLCIVYMGDIDLTGHASGWMSPGYIAAIEANDRAVGLVLETLQTNGLRDRYTILALADHGGHDHGHGTDIPEDMTIPWIINGAGVKRGYAIQTPVNICDTAATIAHALNLPRPTVWEGQPVYDAFA